MRNPARQTRENRTIAIDFQDETTYFRLLDDGKAFVELVMAFILSIGFQLKHKATCNGDWSLTRHSHYLRIRLGGVSIWRLQCTTCRAVFTILSHFFLRYRQMRPEVARDAPLAMHGGLSAGDKADAALAAASLALVSLMPPPPGAVDTRENAVTLPVVEAHDPKFHLLFIFP